MSDQELRDELMTLLVAGHETTASTLAWAFERLVREPRPRSTGWSTRSTTGDADAYLTATIQETLRRRPVLPNAAPRLVVEADRGRRLALRAAGGPASSPTPTCSTTTPTSIPTPTRSGPSASSTSRPAPTPGSRSGAGAGAASAPASRCSRCGSSCGRSCAPTTCGRSPPPTSTRCAATSPCGPAPALGSASGAARRRFPPPASSDGRRAWRARRRGRARSRARSRTPTPCERVAGAARGSSPRRPRRPAAAPGRRAAGRSRTPAPRRGDSGTVRRPPRISASPVSPRAQRTTCTLASVGVAVGGRARARRPAPG